MHCQSDRQVCSLRYNPKPRNSSTLTYQPTYLLQQSPAIRRNHRSGNEPIPHCIYVRLRDILWLAHGIRQRSRRETLQYSIRDVAKQLRVRRARRDHVDAQRREVDGEPARNALHARAVRRHHDPALVRLVAVGAAGEGDGRGRAGVHEGRGQLANEERAEEAHGAGGVHVLDGVLGERDDLQGIAGSVDDVVKLGFCAVGDGVQEGTEVGIEEGGLREVAGMAADVGALVGVGGLEALNGFGDLGRRGAGYDDGGVLLDARLGHAETNAGSTAQDQDAGSGELGGVFTNGGGRHGD